MNPLDEMIPLATAEMAKNNDLLEERVELFSKKLTGCVPFILEDVISLYVQDLKEYLIDGTITLRQLTAINKHLDTISSLAKEYDILDKVEPLQIENLADEDGQQINKRFPYDIFISPILTAALNYTLKKLENIPIELLDPNIKDLLIFNLKKFLVKNRKNLSYNNLNYAFRNLNTIIEALGNQQIEWLEKLLEHPDGIFTFDINITNNQ